MSSKHFDAVLDFVKDKTKHFDESHDWNHAKQVYDLSIDIMDSFKEEYDNDIVTLSSLLHDVCDHKYPDSITKEELRTFIKTLEPSKTDIIMKIIDNVSYSREVAGKRETLDPPYDRYLDAISDADKITAIGPIGLERCQIYTESHGGKMPDGLIKHYDDKLGKLYTHFIRTPRGKELAEPLHNYMAHYVDAMRTKIL